MAEICGVRAGNFPACEERLVHNRTKGNAKEAKRRALPETSEKGVTSFHGLNAWAKLFDGHPCERAKKAQVLDGVADPRMRNSPVKETTQRLSASAPLESWQDINFGAVLRESGGGKKRVKLAILGSNRLDDRRVCGAREPDCALNVVCVRGKAAVAEEARLGRRGLPLEANRDNPFGLCALQGNIEDSIVAECGELRGPKSPGGTPARARRS